jgi:hypothetical protein
MTEVHTLLSQLEKCRNALRDGDEITGIEALQGAVSLSPGNAALGEHLELLSNGQIDSVLIWLDESLSLLRGEDSVSEDSVGAKGFNLFEDFELDDLDLSVPSSAFTSEATRQVERSVASDDEGKTAAVESLGQRLKMSTGKFKIPPPKAKPAIEMPSMDSDFEDPFDDVQIEEGRNLTPIRGVPAIGDVDSDPKPGGLRFGFNQQPQQTGSESDEFDFDLGLSSPQPMTSSPRAEATRPNQLQPSRALQPTPTAQRQRDVVDEDDFFALAESLASESSVPREDRPYRGEPMGKGTASKTKQVMDSAPNPFSHNEPTGVGKGPLEVSYALEEMSKAASSSVVSGQTNLTAILLEARRMYERGEFEAALDICGKVLSRGANADAEELKSAIEGEIERTCLLRLGSLTHVPELNPSADITSLGFDHRAGFLMSQIDGMMSLEDILELASMPRFESLQLLVEFLEKDVIKLS